MVEILGIDYKWFVRQHSINLITRVIHLRRICVFPSDGLRPLLLDAQYGFQAPFSDSQRHFWIHFHPLIIFIGLDQFLGVLKFEYDIIFFRHKPPLLAYLLPILRFVIYVQNPLFSYGFQGRLLWYLVKFGRWCVYVIFARIETYRWCRVILQGHFVLIQAQRNFHLIERARFVSICSESFKIAILLSYWFQLWIAQRTQNVGRRILAISVVIMKFYFVADQPLYIKHEFLLIFVINRDKIGIHPFCLFFVFLR